MSNYENTLAKEDTVSNKDLLKFILPFSISFVLTYLLSIVDLKMVSTLDPKIFSVFGITEGLLFFFSSGFFLVSFTICLGYC